MKALIPAGRNMGDDFVRLFREPETSLLPSSQRNPLVAAFPFWRVAGIALCGGFSTFPWRDTNMFHLLHRSGLS